MKRAYGYTRTAVISKSDEANSNEAQAKLIRDYCKAKNIKLLKVFNDYGKSGSSSSNPGLLELGKQINKTQVDYVVVTDINRLSRNYTVYLAFKNFLRRHGVEIEAIGGTMESSLYGAMLKEVFVISKSFESNSITSKKKKL